MLLAGCSEDISKITLTPGDDARAACNNAYPAVKGNFVALAACLNSVDDKYEKPGNPDVDLIGKIEQSRTVLARHVDAGDITPEDYKQQLAQVQNQVAEVEKHRRIDRDRGTWGISHGLDPNANQPSVDPVPIITPR